MVLSVYTLDEADQWDKIVRSFTNYDVYWQSGYVKAFQVHGDGEPLLVFYKDDKIRGINVVMKRDVATDERFHGKIEEGQYFDLATPYGYGGWIIEGNETEKLFRSYESWIRKNGIISEFVRFHPMILNQEVCHSYYNVFQLGEVVHMNLDSPELIWENITSKNRNMIRKALRNDVKVFNGRFPEIFEKFRKIYIKTMDKDNAKEYYYFKESFYESLLNDLPQNAQVFWAEKDDQIIAASIILAANGRMNFHLSGSLDEFCIFAPSNLIIYNAALWGCANGYNTFLLGGGVGSSKDSLYKFKRGFYKGELGHFFIGKKIYDQEKYNTLVAMRGITENSFFPQYRAQESNT